MVYVHRLACLVAALLVMFTTSGAIPAAEPPPALPAAIKTLLQDRQYADAVKAIDAAAKDPKAARDFLGYWKGRAFHLAGKYDDAALAYLAVEKEYPKSDWASHSKLGRAVSMARKGDFRAAEVTYREEAEQLLSVTRKQEFADVYLEFANAYFKPKDDHQQPDYAKALEFFGKALEMGPQPDKQAEVELLVGQCYQAQSQFAEAAKRFSQFLKDHPASPLAVEASFRLGECQLAQNQREEARRTWQDLLAAHADSESGRIAEAAFQLAATYGLPNPGSDEDLGLGVAALEAFLKKYPMHKLASKAHQQMAAGYFNRGRHEQAVQELKRFLADVRYAGTEETPNARYLLGASYQLQKKYPEALAAWRDYLARHPAHRDWNAVQKAIVDTEFLVGVEAREAKKYADARRIWEDFLQKYPLDGRSASILYEFGRMHFAQDQWDEALADWRRLVAKYPETNESSQAQFMIGVTLEEKLGKLDEALKEYKKVTWGNHQDRARQRMARLTAKSLVIVTDRVFRTNEPAKVKLTTRNVESVTVRAYTVDLETYFRKMHLAQGVEGLDIALIDPDKSFEFKVPKYAEYQQLENEIEVPLTTAGVMAVTVSSKTLEATTLVVRGDLEMIVKCSRDEVFVFAENMQTGKAWPGVRLLISNGSQVFAEAKTGADGVFRESYKELKDSQDVRVFAVADGSVASNLLSLHGVAVAQGLEDKGYLYTDRPAYRAGQVVHVRGIVRRATSDQFVIDKGKKYSLEVFDSRSRIVRQEDVTLNEFGSFHGHFPLPQTSVSGTYRVQISDEDGHSFQGSFTVHEYQLEPVQLSVDSPRRVYYRGEEIEGKIVARYYYGAPLAGREIRYQLATGRTITARTNDQGEVAFKLPTREYRESQTLPLAVMLPERNLQATVNFYLSTQGFTISVTTIRDVYVAGETFEATVTTNDAEGKPSAQKLTLTVLEQTTVEGKVGERETEHRELSTDADKGTARTTLKLEKGGRYILRVEGTDRFGNPISGQDVVQISDDKDQVRLRILADRHTFKAGDTAKVQLHWREPPALALVTFQGARVLGYQLVSLQTGPNELAIPMTAKLAPNFELSVAVMTDARPPKDPELAGRFSRFHEASSPFTVMRDLRVQVTQKRKGNAQGPVQPGEEIEIAVATTDPQGKPVAAEVSLGMIEQSLLDRYGWPMPAIQDFFAGGRREPALRTASSVTFAYRPTTRPINPRLLAEKDRLEIEAEEAERLKTSGVALAGDMPATTTVDLSSAVAGTPAIIVQEESEALLHAVDELREGQQAQKKQLAINGAYGAMPADTRLYFEGAMLRQLKAAQLGRQESAPTESGRFMFGVEVNKNAGVVGGIQLDGEQAALLSNARAWQTFAKDRREFAVLLSDGSQTNVNLGDIKEEKQLGEVVKKLEASGAALLPGMSAAETGYWNPAIVTDKDGKATVTITMPERSTAWKLLAKGATIDTLAGEAEDKLVAKKDLFGELKLPLAFTDGDEAEVLVSVHNDAVTEGTIEVTLKATLGEKIFPNKKTLEVKAKGLQEIPFKVALNRPAENAAGVELPVSFELTVTSGKLSDVVRQTVPLRPYGLPVYASASGSASSDTTVWVEPPKDMPLTSPKLQVTIGPTVERSLLDVVLDAGPAYQVAMCGLSSGLDSAVSDLMAAVGLQKLIGATRDARGPQAESLDARIRASLSLLVSSQAEDGGWSWTGRGKVSNRYASARVVWALSLAKSAGYKVPDDGFEKALNYLSTQVAATPENDYESKAILLQGQAAAGRGDFALANRLHRNRPAMSNAALAHLALALIKMDRAPMAQDLLGMLATRNLDDTAPRRKSATGSLPWAHDATEIRALYALALESVSPGVPKVQELVDWLLAHRTGHRWSPDKATGPATLALCDWFSKTRFEGQRYKLTVFINDIQASVIDVDADALTQTIDIPEKLLKPGKQRINFQLTGRGRYTFQCVLGGFVAADQLKATTTDWTVRRTYEPAPRELDGVPVPRGFGILTGAYTAFRNPLTQLPVGQRGQIELDVHRYNVPAGTPEEQLEYLVITEPLPSGTTVIEQSVQGNFERFELTPGAITFYVGSRQYIGAIRFDVHGYLPGQYRSAPTVVRNAYRPEQLAVSKARPLAVLALGATSTDEYKLSPQELYELGKRLFAQKKYAEAGEHLSRLFSSWQLQPEPYQDTVRMLLDVHLELGPPHEVVRYFEIIKEKYPELEVSFDKIVRVGAAYHEMGEYERSYLVFRATVESSFLRESAVPGFLESQGEFLRSVDVMSRLLDEYPPEGYVAAAQFALAQRVYAYAPQAAADAKLREKKINRVDLVRQALGRIDDFLAAYPEDPAADQAAFSLANALLELKAFQQAIAQCNRYASLFPKSDYLDSFWYVIGYSHFALSEPEAALDMCRKVAEARRLDRQTGRETESPNKWRALYIRGQVYHSLGKAPEAIHEYSLVEDRFPDAKSAIDFFAHKGISLPEVTTVKPGAAAEVDLKYRNVAEVDARVYRIDLMKFSLLKRDLGGITQINLSGIRPYHEAKLALGDGKDYRDRTHKLALPLKEEGAYLVVCRGQDLHASGLVLVTPLAVEVQEDTASGEVRTTVKDETKERYLSDVHVKVIGTRNVDFVSGQTDLRGVFVAEAIGGRSTVIAEAGNDRYAFFRGQQELGPQPSAAAATPATPAAKEPQSGKDQQDLLRGLQEGNSAIQREQMLNLKNIYDMNKKGVQVKEAR